MIEHLTPLEILTLTLIGEARGEPIESIVAVGSVIRNRLNNNPSKYKDLGEVCLAKAQFSCWNENDPNLPLLKELAHKMVIGQPLSEPYYRQCQFLAKGIFDHSLIDNTKGSLNYLTNKLFFSDKRPKWASILMNDPVLHGSQVFFTV